MRWWNGWRGGVGIEGAGRLFGACPAFDVSVFDCLRQTPPFGRGRGRGPLARRSAIRDCQPGPVARQRSMTSGGSRKLINCRGLGDLGLPPLLTTARASMASSSSGSSLYSCGLITCESTRLRSEPKVRREAGLFTVIGFAHAEDVAFLAARGVADHNHSALQQAIADHTAFTIVLAIVYDFNRCICKHVNSVFEVEATLCQCLVAFGGVVADSRRVSVATESTRSKLGSLWRSSRRKHSSR